MEIRLEDALIYLVGPTKCGKSTFASEFKDAIYIATEPGYKFLNQSNFKEIHDIHTWKEFETLLKTWAKTPPDCSCIIIDTVDNLYRCCTAKYCDEQGIKHPSDLGHGKGWEGLGTKWYTAIAQLATLGKGLLFIGHTTVRPSELAGVESDKLYPALQMTGRRHVENLVDFLFPIVHKMERVKDDTTKKTTRQFRPYVCTKENDKWAAGDRTGNLPEQLALDYITITAAVNDAMEKRLDKQA